MMSAATSQEYREPKTESELFYEKIEHLTSELLDLFEISHNLENKIIKNLGVIKGGNQNRHQKGGE